ncbi:extracelular serine carboxypeptidase [Microthyrium microscopicum]|uniref:Extracelular serine carboxypeptidase n=1 Tax=Microthyrium microscopicum TaxID=703497 RepID=A0A6A6UQI8_9PEZI|nr:extracelular serine carboxypeptidase [Microthyrium microscopicum]
MSLKLIVLVAILLTILPTIHAFTSRTSLSLRPRQVASSTSNERPRSYKAYYFEQLIDHFPDSDRYAPHTNATFSQKFFFDDTYYKPGGPVFLYIGGETSAESRWSNLQTGIIQILMNATNGLGVILENRYYGTSYPYNASTTDELRFLTNEQTIADNAYFAQNIQFPNITGGQDLTASATPWILYGGSLAGAETAFSLVEYEGLLWGGIASSAVIHATHGYPEWYNPIQKFGPQDCIWRINKIIDKMDQLVEENNEPAIQKLKELFGLGALEDIRDFAYTIAFPIGGPDSYPTNTWQELNWVPAYDAPDFFQFCNNVTDDSAPTDITDVDRALSEYTHGEPWTGLGGYAKYVKDVVVSQCPSEDLINTSACFSTQNASNWAEPKNSGGRSYTYSSCTESGAYQVANYPNKPSLISRVIQLDYTQQWCNWAFPPGPLAPQAAPSPNGPNLKRYNKYGGLEISARRLAFIDGESDVWRDVCFHSHNATERYGPNQMLITGAGHHWDSYGILNVDAEPDFIKAAHQWEIRRVETWLKEWELEDRRKVTTIN